MSTKLENQLSQIEAPIAPENLKSRCLNTIPVANTTAIRFGKTTRPFRMQRVALAGALLFSTSVVVAFWNTRPISNKTAMTSGSAAFAQTMEAMRQVTYCHVKGRDLGIIRTGQKVRFDSSWHLQEIWFDAAKGCYFEMQDEYSHLSSATAPVSRTLELPDGSYYQRYANSCTVNVVSSPKIWKGVKNHVSAMLMGGVAAGSRSAQFSGFNNNNKSKPQLLSSTLSSWKGRPARILVFEQQPSPENALQGAPKIQMHIYANPDTNLVVARQSFAVSEGVPPRLVAEFEVDYTRPSPALFDAKRLTKGATIHHLVLQNKSKVIS